MAVIAIAHCLVPVEKAAIVNVPLSLSWVIY
jgi:hypothetical protein